MTGLKMAMNYLTLVLIPIILLEVSSHSIPWSHPNCAFTAAKNSSTLDSHCRLRKLSVVDLKNYSFSPEELQRTTNLAVECNPQLIFESFLDARQFPFQFPSLRRLSIAHCKLRRIPGPELWKKLSVLKNLKVSSYNGDWGPGSTLHVEDTSFYGLDSLEELDLSHNNIQNISPTVFCPIGNLRALNLSWNRLTDADFPKSVTALPETESGSGIPSGNCTGFNTRLRILDFSHNGFTQLRGGGFQGLERLRELRLGNNGMTQLPDTGLLGLGELKILNLEANRLSNLPPFVFRSCPALTELSVANNSISSLSPQVWVGIKHLRILDFSFNGLSASELENLSSLSDLVILKLSYNDLDSIHSSHFQFPALQALHLDNNRISSIAPSSFASLGSLQVLDLSRNKLSHISGSLLAASPGLRHLFLDHNQIKMLENNAFVNCKSLQDVGLAGNRLEEIPSAIKSGLPSLQTLDIGENRIGQVNNDSFLGLEKLYGLRLVDNVIKSLPPGFCSSLGHLRVLNLAQNQISEISRSSFAGCPELRALRLDMNNLSNFPAHYLSPELPSLLWLNLSRNGIRGAMDHRALPSTLEWLDLSFNFVDNLRVAIDEDVTKDWSLGTGVEYHLRVLDVSSNNLTSISPLDFPSSLETLRLNHNQLRSVDSDVFRLSFHLTRVELMGNKLRTLPSPPLVNRLEKSTAMTPEFYLAGNNLICDCSLEPWLTAAESHLASHRHPRIADLELLTCQIPHSRVNQTIPVLAAKRNQLLLCEYSAHCFALCPCCEFDACDCEMTCPQNCTCFHDAAWGTNIVDCANADFTEIAPQIPMDATQVFLDGNSIQSLTSHIFIGKTNLRTLHLNGSHIEFIRNRTFNGLKSLETLRLDHNELTALHGFEFEKLVNLRELYLDHNALRHISPSTFSQLRVLEILTLHANHLDSFQAWNLDSNTRLAHISLSSNPWSCDCDFLTIFRTWLGGKVQIVPDFPGINCERESTAIIGQHQILPVTIPCTDDDEDLDIHKIHHNLINENDEEIMDSNAAATAAGRHVRNNGKEFEISRVSRTQDLNNMWVMGVLVSVVFILGGICVCVVFRKNLTGWSTGILMGIRGAGRCSPSSSSSSSRNFGDPDKPTSPIVVNEEEEKLFDAYFLYSQRDEELVIQKLTSGLEISSFRLCLHYRDLCLSPEAPVNSDMILSAAGASRRIFVVLSHSFLSVELSNGDFIAALGAAMYRHPSNLFCILLPPLNPLNVGQIFPQLQFQTPKYNLLDWMDPKFWVKLHQALPQPRTTTTSVSRGHTNRPSLPVPLPIRIYPDNSSSTPHQTIALQPQPPTQLNGSGSDGFSHYQEKQAIAFISQPGKYIRSKDPGNYPYLNLNLGNGTTTRCNRHVNVSTTGSDADELEHLYSTLDSLHKFSL